MHGATLLLNGQVLVAARNNTVAPTSTAELYNPATGALRWPRGRMEHTLTRLLNGQVLAAGGLVRVSNVVTTYLNSAELYTP